MERTLREQSLPFQWTCRPTLAGQRDGSELAKLRDPHIKADTETIRKSLEGNWRPEHLFTLGQSRDLYRIYQQQIVNCDLEIEKMLQQFEPRTAMSLKFLA